jgi:aminoglycoside phosphotransferase (APT) family kinase protein
MASVARHRELPHTLIHCDVHLKNWYITVDRKMGLSDWQNTAIGHWSRDYIYATTTALMVEDRRAWEKELLRSYLDRMLALTGVRISEDEAWLNLRPQLFSALAFWLITLHPAAGMPDMQPKRTTREFLRRILTAIDDHDALGSFA